MAGFPAMNYYRRGEGLLTFFMSWLVDHPLRILKKTESGVIVLSSTEC